MAVTDTLAGTSSFAMNLSLTRAGLPYMTGLDRAIDTNAITWTNGAGANQATCWLQGTGTVTFAAPITLSLADSVNPLSTFSAAVPTADPEGLKIRLITIENEDDTNYITVGQGMAAWTDINTTLIYPKGQWTWTAPSGGITINDGVDDEITVQANVGDCIANIFVLYG